VKRLYLLGETMKMMICLQRFAAANLAPEIAGVSHAMVAA
jgi:hypothetical protein